MAKRARSNAVVASRRSKKQLKRPAVFSSRPSQILDVFVCGDGELGELGLGPKMRNGLKPVNVKRPRLNYLLDPHTVGVVQIAAGGVHAAALTHDSKVLIWGVNDDGALGRDMNKDADEEEEEEEEDLDLNPKETTPTPVLAEFFGSDASSIVQVVATDSATFALTSHRSVYGWGIFNACLDDKGKCAFSADDVELGNGQPRPKLVPRLHKIISLAAGSNHVLALSNSGTIFAWGCNQQHQLGTRSYPKRFSTSQSPGLESLHPAPVFFAGENDCHVYAWGLNNYGQTGISFGAGGDKSTIELPTLVQSLASYHIKQIQGGYHHSIACSTDGAVLTWGRCEYGQTGIALDSLRPEMLLKDERGIPRILLTPTQIPNIRAAAVDAGIDKSIALTESGEAYSWGFSANYRTGLGTEDTVKLPTLIKTTTAPKPTFTKAACGGQ